VSGAEEEFGVTMTSEGGDESNDPENGQGC